MVRSFSTDLVPVSDRADAWLCNAKQICGECRFDFPRQSSFHGSIERRSLAGLELTRFSCSPVSFAKRPVVASSSPDRACVIITQLQGSQQYSQHGAIALLNQHDTTLIDSGLPWTSQSAARSSRLYLRVPRWLVLERLGAASLPSLPVISGQTGLGATLSRLAISLYEEAEIMTAQQGSAAIDAYLTILAGLMGTVGMPALPRQQHFDLRSKVEDFIEAHLPEPTLGPSEVAASAGISVRHLHRLFANRGCTVAEWIRQRRLDRCRADLADVRFSQRSITDIAFFWGFSDSAHFSHCFKQSFGTSPREFRLRTRYDDPRSNSSFPSLLSPARRTHPN
jgi:AraC-like DNA-binding protein